MKTHMQIEVASKKELEKIKHKHKLASLGDVVKMLLSNISTDTSNELEKLRKEHELASQGAVIKRLLKKCNHEL